LRGHYFLDVGCGSGLHSLAAQRAGAERIVSFDLDPASVRTTQRLHEMAGSPASWRVLTGSALDQQFLKTLEPADCVYSWGVLHHTGKMWEAVENAASLVKPGGLFYIGLYTTSPRSGYWTRVKLKYNRASSLGKRWMEARYATITLALCCTRLENPIRYISEYTKKRGMDFMSDQRDWLGGYPFEHASAGETVQFGTKKLGFQLVNIQAGVGAAHVSEYLFRRPE